MYVFVEMFGCWTLAINGTVGIHPWCKKEAQIDMYVGIELLPSYQLILICIAWRLSLCVRTACTDKYSPCFMCVPHLTDCKRIPINRHIPFNFVWSRVIVLREIFCSLLLKEGAN